MSELSPEQLLERSTYGDAKNMEMTPNQMAERIKELERERDELLKAIEANIKAHGTESLEVPQDAWVKVLEKK